MTTSTMSRCRSAVAVGLAAILAAAPAAAEEKRYTMQDLEALAKSESWSELVQHLEDIAPAARDKKWQQIAERGILGQLDSMKSDKNPFGALIYADGFTKRYPWLKKNRGFMKRRAEAGLKGFELCYEHSYSGAPCNERFLPYVEGDPGNVEFALHAGQLVTRKQHHYFAMPLFALAVAWSKGAKKVCEADRLSGAMLAALKLPKSYTAQVKAAQEVARGCFGPFKRVLLDAVDEKNSYFLANACPLLQEKKALDARQAPKCKAK